MWLFKSTTKIKTIKRENGLSSLTEYISLPSKLSFIQQIDYFFYLILLLFLRHDLKGEAPFPQFGRANQSLLPTTRPCEFYTYLLPVLINVLPVCRIGRASLTSKPSGRPAN